MPVEIAPPRAGKGGLGGEAARSLFSKFQSLLEANTAALATMAALERMGGGEYVFDRTFLEKSAREVADCAHRAVYALNAMTGNRHVDLYDRFMAINAAVEDILAGRPGPDDERLVRPLGNLRLEDRPKVGREAAALGELAGRLGLPVPPGFVVTPAAWSDGRLVDEAREAVTAFLADAAEGLRLATVTVAMAPAAGAADPDRRLRHSAPARAEAVIEALEHLGRTADTGRAAIVTASPPASVHGRIRSAWTDTDGAPVVRLDIWAGDDPETGCTHLLERAHPFAPKRSTCKPGPAAVAPEAWGTLAAGQALAAERLLGAPVELDFGLTDEGRVAFEAARLLPPSQTAQPGQPAQSSGPAAGETLLSGGEAACLGAASGAVVHVDERTTADTFPFGAVAVARSAAPALAPLLRRAGAMVAEVGDAAGHLAAVAREYRTPTLLGLPGALDVLKPGMVVTVDAEAGVVTAGVSDNRPATDASLSPDDPEYLTLRRLLRRVARLTLTDPSAPEFCAAGCRTLHDILHFAHDRAVAVLADLRQAGFSDKLAVALPLPVPLDLRVLDIGGGLAPEATGLAAVRSRPLGALLTGLLTPGMWDATPGRLGLGDIFEAMGKPLPETGGNLAIAARAYCNVSLRLGYHFTVIDAYLDRSPEKNVIYFRFVGGLANADGRAARALFLQRVLSRHDFRVDVAGDMVVARAKMIEPEAGEAALRLLGALCAFARQRDTSLTGPDAATALERAFVHTYEAATRQGGESS